MNNEGAARVVLSCIVAFWLGYWVGGIGEAKAQVTYFSNSLGLPNGYSYTLANTTFFNGPGGELLGTAVSMNSSPVWTPMVPVVQPLVPIQMPIVAVAPIIPALPLLPVWGHK